MVEHKGSGVYIMQASNELVKIGKANNPDIRRMQLEQAANMFNQSEKITVKLIKFYPVYDETVAFALESYLHEHFAACQAGTSSREVFQVDAMEVVKVANIWHNAFSVEQTIIYRDELFKKTGE